MKNLLFASIAYCIFSVTSLPASAQKLDRAKKATVSRSKEKSLRFIDNIEIKADPVLGSTGTTILSTDRQSVNQTTGIVPAIESVSSVQFKYAQLLDCNVEDVQNISLYQFIDEWWQTRYHYGGTNKKGIDCSAFTGTLMSSVFDIKLPRTAREQYNQSNKIGIAEMQEGDLVFFNTRGGVSHVGVYLGEGHFVHASTNQGVMINSLEEPYYAKRVIGGGRVIEYTSTISIAQELN